MLISGLVSVRVVNRLMPKRGRQPPAGRGHDLHQSPRVGDRTDVGIEGGLLRDQRRDDVGIELVHLRVLADQIPVHQRKQDLADLDRQLVAARRSATADRRAASA